MREAVLKVSPRIHEDPSRKFFANLSPRCPPVWVQAGPTTSHMQAMRVTALLSARRASAASCGSDSGSILIPGAS